ncbi:hypothetical protein [Nonomuraea indica]|uniref:hypothetical protein n=1 Tax=Nonomuraea indica TaxID=1581193 RepID=UPI000C7B8C2B|nr:hypothetical protein [Nonomuraea indica]
MTEQESVTLAVAKLSEITAVGIAEIKGSLALLVQRADHADRRVDELSARQEREHQELADFVAAQEVRLRALENDRAGRAEVQSASGRRAVWISIVIAAIGLAITIVVTLLNAR